MKVFVIGAAGQLGYDLKRSFATGYEFIGADIPGSGQDIDIDITDAASVEAAVKSAAANLVINSAAFTNVDGCENNKEACWAVNAAGAGNVARACAAAGTRLIHVSTDYVFDGTGSEPYKEDDEPAPLGEYGKSKFTGEEEIRAALPDRHLIVRTAWLFGSYGHNFVKTMLRLGRERDQLKVVNDQSGSPTYAGHLAAAIKSLAEGRMDDPGVYHMTGSGQCTWYDFAAEIFRLAEVDVDLQPTTTTDFAAPAPRPAYSVLANTRAPEIKMPDWHEGLKECLAQLGELKTAGDAEQRTGGKT